MFFLIFLVQFDVSRLFSVLPWTHRTTGSTQKKCVCVCWDLSWRVGLFCVNSRLKTNKQRQTLSELVIIWKINTLWRADQIKVYWSVFVQRWEQQTKLIGNNWTDQSRSDKTYELKLLINSEAEKKVHPHNTMSKKAPCCCTFNHQDTVSTASHSIV